MCRCRRRMLTPEEYKKASKARYFAEKPKLLPRRRKREELTPPPELEALREKRPRKCNSRTTEPQRIPYSQSQQQECMLLQRLPSEIRLNIWELMLGGETIHITSRSGRVIHNVCPQDSTCNLWWCTYHKSTPTSYTSDVGTSASMKKEQAPKWSELSLLQTCRQIYSEAINILYTHNTFSFHSLWTPHFFRLVTLPKRFALIRTMKISHSFRCEFFDGAPASLSPRIPFPTPEAEWDTTCKAILAMTGLRELQFTVLPTHVSNHEGPHTLVKTFQKLEGLDLGEDGFQIKLKHPNSWCLFRPDAKTMEKKLNEEGLRCKVLMDADPDPVPTNSL